LEKRHIPGTDLNVSTICLGTFTFGTPVIEANAVKLVHYALDSGMNFIDTANMYEGYTRVIGSPGGVAEEILGKALAGRRDGVILATKVGMKVGNEPEDEYTSPAAIRKQLDKSLRRLDTEAIDIYYLHRPDPVTPLADILDTLGKAITEGKIRYYGISNYSAQQLSELLNVADTCGLPRPVICQPPLSLLKNDALTELIPLCIKEKIAVAPYQVYQGGLLTGKYKRGSPMPVNSRKTEKSEWLWELTNDLYDKLGEIETSASEAGMSMARFAVKWVLDQPGIVSAIIGARNKDQLDEAIKL